jgi:hypothetical protein
MERRFEWGDRRAESWDHDASWVPLKWSFSFLLE